MRYLDWLIVFVKNFNHKISLAIPIVCLFQLFIISISDAQQTRYSENSIELNHLQIKEGLNYGLVFKGLGLHYDYSLLWDNENYFLEYKAQVGFSYLKARGISAGNIHFSPVKLAYLLKTVPAKNFRAGPFFITDYNYELYPDLQSGYSFWFTHFSIGGEIMYPFEASQQNFTILLRTTAFGFASRPPVYRNPYFFDLSFRYAVEYLNEDIHFGSWNRYNVSDLELRWQPHKSRLVYGYTFQYLGYYQKPRITMINQSFKIIFLPKMHSK